MSITHRCREHHAGDQRAQQRNLQALAIYNQPSDF
jgi:hypothetical protein